MDRRRAAGALLALAACIACSTAAPTASNQTALEMFEGPSEGCYYNFQHYGEGDRIMTNEPCLNCTCHNRMLMCYLKVCPFTKPIGQDCTIEKRADQCCPIVTCPDVPVDLLTSTSTSSPAEYGATGLGKIDKYGCSIHGKYFPEGSKVPPTPNKPCEHCYCIRNMTTCVMQECTLHVDGCTPIYHKDVCCPVRYSCDHLEDEMLLLDDMTTTVRPTPGFLLTTTTMPSATQISQNCVHDDQIFADGALIKTEIACEHCYCMKGDIVCVVQECGTPMENEGKNCTSLPPRQGQCCPDTYICEGDELLVEPTTSVTYEELTTLSPPRRVEGSGYRNEPDEPYTELPAFEGSGEEHATTLDSSDMFTSQKQTTQIIDEIFSPTEESPKPSLTTAEPDKKQNTVPDESNESDSESQLLEKTTPGQEATTAAQPSVAEITKEADTTESKTTSFEYLPSSDADSSISKDDEFIMTTESILHYTVDDISKITEMKVEAGTTESSNIMEDIATQHSYSEPSSSEASTVYRQDDKTTTSDASQLDEEPQVTTPEVPKYDTEDDLDKHDISGTHDKDDKVMTTTESRIEPSETTSVNPVENEIDEDVLPPGRIPGEGDCLLNGVTYKNSTKVPNINNCHSSCKCVSSIVKCDPIICSPPPEHMDNMNDCQPIYDTPDACCPTYICHSRETVPPESHSQMSGTESPKPALESECHGEQCQPLEVKPISKEPCNSDNCEQIMDDKEKECKNGVCGSIETSSTGSPPLKHPEACIGDNCLHSTEICTEDKCQPSSTSQTVCDNENGCQPSEACEGNNCAVETGAKDDHPICNDPEGCTVPDTSKCEGSQCHTSNIDTPINVDTQVPDEKILQSECKDENCRRKDQSDDSKITSECSDSSCITQKTDGEGVLTTESAMKDQIYKESTTEIIGDIYSKLPESEETHIKPTTENQDISLGHSVTIPGEDIGETVTEKGEAHTDISNPDITKMEETITEVYNEPETEDHQTVIPGTFTTKPKEQVTESIEDITKEMLTDSPSVVQDEKHSSDLPKEDVSDITTKPFDGSTETLDIEPHDQKDKNDVTETTIVKDFTQAQEISTKPTHLLETTSELLETDVTEKEFTNKPEMSTELQNQEQTSIQPQDNVNTEPQQNVITTESAVTSLPEMTAEDHLDDKVKDDKVTSTGEYEETNMPATTTTQQSIEIKESSEPHDTKLEETATKKFDDEIEKEHIPTESPTIEKETESPQASDMETSPESIDLSKTTESSAEHLEDLSKPTEMYDAVTNIQDTSTTPNELQEEHATSVSSIIHATESFTTEENLATQTHDVTNGQETESNLPESPFKESLPSTIPEEFEMKEITTQQPEKPTTTKQQIPEVTTDIHGIDSQTVLDKLEEHTDTSIKDINEVSTTTPDEEFQDDTHPKEPSAISTDETGLGTTISSILFDKDHDVTSKYTDTETDSELSGERTTMSEIDSTKSEEPTSLDETEKKTLETSTKGQLESETVTTESLKQPYEDGTEMPDSMQANVQSQEPSTDEHTLAPAISSTEGYGDSADQTIPVSIDESKTKEQPQYTTPDTVSKFTEKQYTTLTDDHVTESTEDETKGIDSSEESQEPPVHVVPNETEGQNIVTHAFETTTQTQDTETKLATEVKTDQEIPTTPTHIVKEEQAQTESPMSLITEPSESLHPEDGDHTNVDKTTQIPEERVPDEEETKTPDEYDTKPQIPDTESPQVQETEKPSDTKIPSQIYTEKVSHPDSAFTTPLQEYTTVKVLDIHDKEKTSPVTSTEFEKLAPTTEYQDTMFTPSPDRTEPEFYPTDILHESSSGAPTMISSDESFATEQEKITSRYPEMSDSITTVSYDHEVETKPENIPVKDHTLEDAAEQSQNDIDFTTVDSILSETSKEPHQVTQQSDKIDDVKDENAVTTEFTTKYPEILDEGQDKQTGEPEPSKQAEYTESPEQHITTELEMSSERPVSPDILIHSTVDDDYEKSTEVLQTSDVKDVTTPRYQDLTTPKEESIPNVPESHLITSDISTTERSEITPSDESNRRTLLPSFETVPSEQYTTEKQKITESPEITKSQEIGQTDLSQETSSYTPEKESATLVPIPEEVDYVTSIPAVTEDNVSLLTETVPAYQDHKIPEVTENIEEQTSEQKHTTSQPETELDISKDTQTEQPIETDQDTLTEKTTAHDELVNIPVETIPAEIPPEYTVSQESQTEASIPKVTEISEPSASEASVPLVTESDMIIPIETEPTLLKETEIVMSQVTQVSIPKETESNEFEVTEASVPKETGSAVSEVSEGSVPQETGDAEPEVTEVSIPKETEAAASGVTEGSVPKETVPTVSEVTEDYVPKETGAAEFEDTEISVPKETVPTVSEVTEGFVPKETEAAVSEVTETSVGETTKASMSEITDTSATESSEPKAPEVTEVSQQEITEVFATESTKYKTPEVTEASVSDITESSISEITKAAVSEITEESKPEVTEASVAEATETTVPKETESEITDREPEETTSKSKDEEPEITVVELHTLEPIHSSSETTPYLVELQEHTTKVDEDISLVTVTEEDRTKAPEIYQTERGDQPLDNIPDKFTQEDIHDQYTTKETFTKKDEQLTTLPPEQASEYTEKLPEKTEIVTEEVTISSESPISTLLHEEIKTQTTSSGEASVTISPTVSLPLDELDKHTTAGYEIGTTSDKKDMPLYTEKTPEQEATDSEEALIPVVTKATTIKSPEEITTQLPVVDNKFTKPEDKPSEAYSPTSAPDLSKPGMNEIQPTEELPSPDFSPSGSSGYGQEPDYVEEDQAFGPGTCRYGGKVYVSAQQIPRDDPCDFCFCFRSDIICLQQSCPPPIHGCHEEPIQGFCCPRYECPVSMATTLNVTTTTTTTTTTLPPHFLPHAYKGAAQRRGCQIKGHSYKVGEVVRASSGPCLHCTCGGDGQMKCDPKACTPEPMLRQMIAAAVSAKRRR